VLVEVPVEVPFEVLVSPPICIKDWEV